MKKVFIVIDILVTAYFSYSLFSEKKFWLLFLFVVVQVVLTISIYNNWKQQVFDDKNGSRAIQAKKVLDSLPKEFHASLQVLVHEGKYLDAIKQLRIQVSDLGLQEAKNVIDLLRSSESN